MDFFIGIAVGVVAALIAAGVVGLLLARKLLVRSRGLEEQALQAEHLANVGALTGGLAHEIRNPLSTLNLNIQLMREDLARPATDKERRIERKLEVLESQTRHLRDILEKFLRFAGKHKVNRVKQDLNKAMEEIVEFYRPQLEKAGLSVRTSFAEKVGEVELDRDLFAQAVTNLILNAQAAMPDGGELMFMTRPEGTYVRIDITDTGVGIEKENIEKVFDVSYSTRKGGLGLGLPTVKRIVREHDGRIEAQSEVGRGTQISMFLPAADS